jgi:hypothetical protein
MRLALSTDTYVENRAKVLLDEVITNFLASALTNLPLLSGLPDGSFTNKKNNLG